MRTAMGDPGTPLVRMLQLASAALPVGSFAYSQGLEFAVEAQWVVDEASLERWLAEQMRYGVARVDLPMLARLIAATRRGDRPEQARLGATLIAMRETSELVADDCARGRALARLLGDLDVAGARFWLDQAEIPYAGPMAAAFVAFDIALSPALEIYAWSWLENQILAGVKLVPLGQVAGQRLLLELGGGIAELCTEALGRGDEELGGTLPIVALASSLHETQYTRLFRS
ncbi:MAG: urease accessory UreF family protein [Deltaproteobacteria bacterium]